VTICSATARNGEPALRRRSAPAPGAARRIWAAAGVREDCSNNGEPRVGNRRARVVRPRRLAAPPTGD
jgi:hypothetical protein